MYFQLQVSDTVVFESLNSTLVSLVEKKSNLYDWILKHRGSKAQRSLTRVGCSWKQYGHVLTDKSPSEKEKWSFFTKWQEKNYNFPAYSVTELTLLPLAHSSLLPFAPQSNLYRASVLLLWFTSCKKQNFKQRARDCKWKSHFNVKYSPVYSPSIIRDMITVKIGAELFTVSANETATFFKLTRPKTTVANLQWKTTWNEAEKPML